ncbi:hypothetical protein HNY73_015623 [Argiope bruennichi]|uniref:DUF4371 domain-containing protein n=1 Tax=Argiope bruennichi TaxID=94029 RepID=A0A8T0EY71_ARGBR|nr:hypothetical protein HNY73_015623 [Argiope bruennichi]
MFSKKDKKSGAQNTKRKLQREETNQKLAESLNKYFRNTIGLDGQAIEPGSSTSTSGLEMKIKIWNENLSENVNSSEYDQEETTIVPIENLDVDVENSPDNNLIKDGCNDWAHLTHILKTDGSSASHLKHSSKCSELKMSLRNLCTLYAAQQRLYDAEKVYWQSVTERLIYLIQYLARQCLAFRGSSKELHHSDNGNILKLVETIAKFDPIIAEHFHKIQTSQKKNIAHYLGDKIQNEIISIISEGIKKYLLHMIKPSKYYSLILDTTPDVSHTEQLTIVIRFVYKNEKTNKA